MSRYNRISLLSIYTSLGLLLFIGSLLISCQSESTIRKDKNEVPEEWFFNQRAFPYPTINEEGRAIGLAQAKKMRQTQSAKAADFTWQTAGPTNTGGRVTDIALHPLDTNIFYIGTSLGGVWKTIDCGESWTPIFDEQQHLSIGNLALDPQNPETLYVGTGEANASATSGAFFGDGIYKTTDGGASWIHLGLSNSHHIGRIVVDPTNSERVWVAVAGQLYQSSEERGVYLSENGGQDWQQMFHLTDSTACIDLVVNPDDPQIIYAAMWERTRKPWGRNYAGLTSGIYRSKDGGLNWEAIKEGLPTNGEKAHQVGRIGLSIAPNNPDILFACFTTDSVRNFFDGVYRTENGGDEWYKVEDQGIENSFFGFGWFFSNIRIHPRENNIVYLLGGDLFSSNDGGRNWTYFTNGMHVDQHALEIHPLYPNFVVVGNDGGLYVSHQNGRNWQHINNLPITQFYTCEIDNQQPERLYGGTQDNGTNRTLNWETQEWEKIFGADGFRVLVDPTDNSYVYVETQWGGLYSSYLGGEPFSFTYSTSGIDGGDRTNWHTPYEFNPQNPKSLYYGSMRLYKTVDQAGYWEPISEDLTNGQIYKSEAYATITSIAIAPSDTLVIYVGTDDGNVQKTTNEGQDWALISEDLPLRHISRIAVHPDDADVVYVTLSGYRNNDYTPHVFKSIDGGETWEDISSNLPELPVNDIVLDPFYEDYLYVATDAGVFYSQDDGENWEVFGDGLPSTIITDLTFHADTYSLVAATFGRSMYLCDLGAPLYPVGLSEPELSETNIKISPNPFDNQLTIHLQDFTPEKYQKLTIYDVSGKLIYQQAIQGNTIVWNGKSNNNQLINEGMYVIQITNDKEFYAKQIIKMP